MLSASPSKACLIGLAASSYGNKVRDSSTEVGGHSADGLSLFFIGHVGQKENVMDLTIGSSREPSAGPEYR